MASRFRDLGDRFARRLLETRYGRDMVIRALAPRTRFMTVDNGDHVITFSPTDYLGRSVFVKGHFDRDHVGRLMRHLEALGIDIKGKTLLEIGGNIGTHTIYFALTGAFRRILSIEPDPRNYDLLVENIGQNGLADLVIPINRAATDTEGELDFFLHPSNHGKSSPVRASQGDAHIIVRAQPVSAILRDAGMADDDIGLVWMDIEGHEPIAARGMLSLLARRVPMHMEFTSEFYGPAKAREFVDFLASYYDDCLLFFNDDSEAPAKVRDIPTNREQFDILLLP